MAGRTNELVGWVEEEFGGVSIFVNGPCGNVSSNDRLQRGRGLGGVSTRILLPKCDRARPKQQKHGAGRSQPSAPGSSEPSIS